MSALALSSLLIGGLIGFWFAVSTLVYVLSVVLAVMILRIPTSRRYILGLFKQSPYYSSYTLSNEGDYGNPQQYIRRIPYYLKCFVCGYYYFWYGLIVRQNHTTPANDSNARAQRRENGNAYSIINIIQKMIDIELQYRSTKLPHKLNLPQKETGCQPHANRTLLKIFPFPLLRGRG